jgi:hypothetical protein
MTKPVDIISDLLNQLNNETKEFESFCLALGKVNYKSNAAELLIFIRGITKSFEVIEDLKVCMAKQHKNIWFSVWVKSQKNLNCPDKAKRGQNRGGTKNE